MERSWRDYDRLEGDVNAARTNLLEQLEALGSPQVGATDRRRTSQTLWWSQRFLSPISVHASYYLGDSNKRTTQHNSPCQHL